MLLHSGEILMFLCSQGSKVSSYLCTMGKTVVLGASPNPGRYSHIATKRLLEHDEEVWPVGMREGVIGSEAIITDRPLLKNIDTITLYVGPKNQESWKDYIFALQPKRVIFNPGTENPVLEHELEERGIESEIACTLVLLSMGTYAIK